MKKIILVFAVGVVSCGKSSFDRNDQKRDLQSNRNGGQTSTNGTDQKSGSPNNDGSTTNIGGGKPTLGGGQPTITGGTETQENTDAIGKCLAAWGQHPFQGVNIPPYKTIKAAVAVLNTGAVVVDNETTAGPAMILIVAGVNVLSQSLYQLNNPYGWYCLKVNVNVKSALDVSLACQARLADNRVSVNVLSQQNGSVGQVGVNVMSDVRVNQRCP